MKMVLMYQNAEPHVETDDGADGAGGVDGVDGAEGIDGDDANVQNEDHSYEERSTLMIGNVTQPRTIISAEPTIFGTRCVESDFTGRSNELAFLKEFFQPQQQLKSTKARICVVAGRSGIGKTQLVNEFIAKNRSSYQNVIWIDSRNTQSINDSFQTLAKQINDNGVGQDAKSAIEEVLSKFSTKTTLFVYDDVETIDSIEFALVGPASVDGSHVLITSRVQYWRYDIEVCSLKVWERHDAVEYVSKRLRNAKDNQDDIKSLVNMLGLFPLALRLATAYIIYQRTNLAAFEISDYLKKIGANESNIRRSLESQDDPSKDSAETFIALTITIEAIQRNQTRGLLAAKILNIIAYFAPKGIRKILLDRLIPCDQDSQRTDETERVAAAIRLLTNYDLVTFDKQDTQIHLNVHRSVQEVLKFTLRKGEQEESLLKDALKLISELSEHFQTEIIVAHAILVFQSAKIYPSLVNEWSTLPAIVLLKLLKKYPYTEAPSLRQLRERIQKIDSSQNQGLRLAEQHAILTGLALEYLPQEVDGTFWKYTLPIAVTGVAAAVGLTVINQYVERATENAVTKAFDKAVQVTEAAVDKAIDDTNQKWIGGVATGVVTVALAAVGVLIGSKI